MAFRSGVDDRIGENTFLVKNPREMDQPITAQSNWRLDEPNGKKSNSLNMRQVRLR